MTDQSSGDGLAVGSVVAPELGAVLLTEQSLDDLLDLVVVVARRTLPGADGVSLSLLQDERVRTSHYSDELVRELDGVQYQAGTGPCLESIETRECTLLDVTDEDDHRFETFTGAARSRFITAVFAVPLRTPGATIGSINFYSASVERFVPDQVELGMLFAKQASILLANAVAFASSGMVNKHLEQALISRERIGEAKGIIMATYRCSPEEAFDRLRTESQRANRKLRDVAETYVASIQDINGSA